jgi:hypothetical protein
MGAKQIRLEKNVQEKILRQIVEQAEKDPDNLMNAAMSRPKYNPPHLGNYIDMYV